MDKERIDQIIDKHHGEASSLIQVLLEIQSENQLASQGGLGEGRRKIAGPYDADTAHSHLL